MINDLPIIFSWWFMLFGIGVIFLPLTLKLFPNFFDRGYAFSKILGILLISYVVWLLGSLKILSFTTPHIFLIIFIFSLISFSVFRKNSIPDFRSFWKIFLFEEIVFLLCLTAWSFVRGFQPNIEGLEKFMDFGFINSLLRGQYFPPLDIWMAGKTINYYYFGHLVAAVLTKTSGIDSSITYNLMVATIFALAFIATFSLGANLLNIAMPLRSSKSEGRKIVIGGLLSAFLLTLGGNLHTLWWFITHNFSFTGYWYPDATRFIVEKFGALDNTIHEFPLYSFVVSDLHGHVSDIPFVLLFLAILFSFLTSKSSFLLPTSRIRLGSTRFVKSRRAAESRRVQLLTSNFPLLSLILAVMYMTNSWDFPIYFMILGLVVLYSNFQKFGTTLKTIIHTLLFSLCCLLFAIIFSLPFHLNFTQIAQGVALVHAHTPIWMLPVLWGFPWFMILIFLFFTIYHKFSIFNFNRHPENREGSRSVYASPALPASQRGEPRGRLDSSSSTQNDLSKFQILPSDIFIIILIGIATLLIIIPEFLYVKDIYIASYHRANTMFKLTYQSFMLYSITSGYIIIRLLFSLKSRIFLLLFLASSFSLLASVFVYPNFAVTSYYGELSPNRYQGLAGFGFLKNSDNLAVINWFNKNVSGQPAILEAVGDSYTLYNQVSMATGLPTVEGWLVHEWLWRGSFNEPGKRADEVQTIYETEDINIALPLLKKHNVKYVIVGDLEKTKYQIQEEKFTKLGKIVFQQGTTKIFQVN